MSARADWTESRVSARWIGKASLEKTGGMSGIWWWKQVYWLWAA
jgi:hypothetical protein